MRRWTGAGWAASVVVGLLVLARTAGAQINSQPPALSPPTVGDEERDSSQRQAFTTTSGGSTDWAKVIGNSLRLAGIEHMTRLMLQPDTRRALSGPFIADYVRSIRRPDGWNDGNAWPVNYIGHPIHGAAAGFVWIAGQRDKAPPPGFSRQFWSSRGEAALWAAAYSLQFELGPFSEASIGNVGMHPGTTGWVDHVMTPVGALGFMVLEDWVDHTVIVRIERSTGNIFLRAALRIALNPSRSMSSMAQGQMPWTRFDRNLRR